LSRTLDRIFTQGGGSGNHSAALRKNSLRSQAYFNVEKLVYTLKEGDSISFSADVPHQLRNIGNEPLHAFWIIPRLNACWEETSRTGIGNAAAIWGSPPSGIREAAQSLKGE